MFTPRTLTSSSFRSISRPVFSQINQASKSSSTAFRMSSTSPAGASTIKIENTEVSTAPGVSLSSDQKTIVGSILDLFAGRPSLPKLSLWRDDATFEDPITIAQGRDKYAAQWYGLQSAFSEIERLHHSVTNAGNPILMDLKTRYVIKGIGKEQIIDSVVAIHTDEQGKIAKVEDRWNGKLPDSSIANVSSILQFANPFWWAKYWEGWAFWCWSWTWETSIWRAFRHLNAVTVPKIIHVPKNAEEDAKRGN